MRLVHFLQERRFMMRLYLLSVFALSSMMALFLFFGKSSLFILRQLLALWNFSFFFFTFLQQETFGLCLWNFFFSSYSASGVLLRLVELGDDGSLVVPMSVVETVDVKLPQHRLEAVPPYLLPYAFSAQRAA